MHSVSPERSFGLKKKLLIISSGTTAAGVVQELQRQIQARQANDRTRIEYKSRCIDTANLSLRGFLSGEWLPLNIDNQFMDVIYESQQDELPEIKAYLYPGLLPETTSDGGGGIRYNGAGAIILNRRELESWIQSSMISLGKMGDQNAEFSVAIVISAVGATGSGTLERLLESVIASARAINPDKDPQIDVFILMPGKERVTELGRANTVALFAEMAASRLAGKNQSIRRYKGRTILVGWGDRPRLTSIEQLQEAAATLIRTISDPITGIESAYRERAMDNTMLHATDPHTHLPSHLSSATAINIGLGNLEEQIIQLDTARLLTEMALTHTDAAQSSEEKVNPIMAPVLRFLNGDDDANRYRDLLDTICENIVPDTQSLNVQTVQRLPANQRALTLKSDWQSDIEIINGSGRASMRKKAETLSSTTIKEMIQSRREALATGGYTLSELRDHYQSLRTMLNSTLKYALATPPPESDNDREVNLKLDALRGGLFQNNQLRESIRAIQGNITSRLHRQASGLANMVLKELVSHCALTINNLDVIMTEAKRQKKIIDDLTDGELPLRIDTDNMLHMAALVNKEEIKRYYEEVSIFHPPEEASAYQLEENLTEFDQLAAFRRQMLEEKKIDIFFSGKLKEVSEVMRTYAAEIIQNKMKVHSVVDVLLHAGEGVLLKRLEEAAQKAHSLISFVPNLASKSREMRHICAFYKDREQHNILIDAMQQTFRDGPCTLEKSDDPTEIIVYYYVDGLSMSAIKDLSGWCFDAFLEHRRNWYQEVRTATPSLNGNNGGVSSIMASSIPVYCGQDAENLVRQTEVITRLYEVRDRSIITRQYGANDIPELGSWTGSGTNKHKSTNASTSP